MLGWGGPGWWSDWYFSVMFKGNLLQVFKSRASEISKLLCSDPISLILKRAMRTSASEKDYTCLEVTLQEPV